MINFRFGLLAIGLIVSGCAAPPASFERVRSQVGERTNHHVAWNRGSVDDARITGEVRALLRRPLTAERAVQVALLNNRDLQASFEEIGIAQADLIEAGLLTNPSLGVSVRFPDRSPSGTNVEYSIAQNLIELILRPARTRIAAGQVAQAETRAADQVLKVAAEVKTAFYTAQASRQLLDRLRVVSQVNETAVEFTKRLHEAGNVSDLDLANQQSAYEQSRLEIAQTELQLRRDREKVNRLLGFWGSEINWDMVDHLPEIPGREVSLRGLESRALGQRLDLQARKMQLDSLGEALALRTHTRFLPAEIKLGVDTERDPDGVRVTGPTLDLELPIFNQGQGAIAKLTAQYRQAEREVESLAINIRSEVRSARDQLVAARDLTSHIEKQLLPTRRRALNLTLEQYNYMLKGTYDLLLAKENEIAAERSYLESWRDYWIAHAELERAVGGSLSGLPSAKAAQP